MSDIDSIVTGAGIRGGHSCYAAGGGVNKTTVAIYCGNQVWL